MADASTPLISPSGPSIQQELYPAIRCFGCGPENAGGLRIASYRTDRPGEFEAVFTPSPHHDNGWGFLNGGIIATLLDCHSAAVLFASMHDDGRVAPDGGLVPHFTTTINVRYRRPTPLDRAILVWGRVAEVADRRVVLATEIRVGGEVTALASVTWKRAPDGTTMPSQT
jgi:acyl-coenzyme A thioesterase PaaI-like protein